VKCTILNSVGLKFPFIQRDDYAAGDVGYEAYKAANDAQRFTWTEIDEATMWYLLEVVPPVYFRGSYAPGECAAFFVGEPASHDARGVVERTACVTIRGRHFIRDLAMDGFKAAVEELREALAVPAVPAAQKPKPKGTTAELRALALNAEHRLDWGEAARFYREAIAVYPPTHARSEMYRSDLASLESRARACEAMKKIEAQS
jgi:hypothetical protein